MANDSELRELGDPITVAEVKAVAARKIEKAAWDYFASGADEEKTLRRNEEAFDRLFIRPRVLRDVTNIDTSTTLFGTRYPVPFGIAPTARQKLAGGNGEIDVARAAVNLGLNTTLSSGSSVSLEEVVQARSNVARNPPPLWAQLYITKDSSKALDLIKRAGSSGCEALVLTVDTPILGNRVNERRALEGLHPSLDTSKPAKQTVNRLLLDARTAQQAENLLASAEAGSVLSAALTWSETLPFLRSNTSLKIIVKGIMTPEDALLAIEHGVDAIIVSNHGGRQLDCVTSTIEALPDIVEAVAGRIPVILDGGITRGSDIFKALGLGADFVLVGRAALWGLGFDGQRGVERVCNILERELNRTMALAGHTQIKDIGRQALAKESGFGVTRF